ncbi:hypothetical protein K466DRAFT_666795 [Polyporus arcularius HHB13444]|uniref:BTB domain-containing protein n=1 Tax=Polyporus arcularius HHB13444 TaxID=1314778 RepID=A0A5C3NXI1_9APHY|nr:hypothetical protein K466DRAFT_666795 [Polyporus arcularius HHB13444]
MSTTSPPPDSEPRKRARTSHDEDECVDAHEDKEFWFDDGTIVLLAGQVKFRVYRGVLTEHSPVFVEMLSLPQPSEAPTSQYSCPVIRLHDNPETLRHVFRLLMPRKIAIFVYSAPTFDMVSAYIRIAHKYQMDALLHQWLEYLKKHFTHRFADWVSHKRTVPEGFAPIHAIGVVNLARLTGVSSILPTALAVCATLGSNIVEGFTRGDDDGLEQLSMDDLGRCFSAKGLLIQANANAVALALAPRTAGDECSTRAVCLEQIRVFCECQRSSYDSSYLYPEGSVPFWKRYGRRLSDYNICRHCLEMMEGEYLDIQGTRTWMRLPEITDVQVDGWNL